MSEGKLSITLKAGQGFDSPWIVVHPDSVDEGVALLNEIAAKGLDLAAANAAKELQAKYAVAPATQVSTQSTQAVSASQPTQANAAPLQIETPAPAGGGPTCQHGARIWKDFTSKKGNAIKGWFCPSQNRNDECPAQFAK